MQQGRNDYATRVSKLHPVFVERTTSLMGVLIYLVVSLLVCLLHAQTLGDVPRASHNVEIFSFNQVLTTNGTLLDIESDDSGETNIGGVIILGIVLVVFLVFIAWYGSRHGANAFSKSEEKVFEQNLESYRRMYIRNLRMEEIEYKVQKQRAISTIALPNQFAKGLPMGDKKGNNKGGPRGAPMPIKRIDSESNVISSTNEQSGTNILLKLPHNASTEPYDTTDDEMEIINDKMTDIDHNDSNFHFDNTSNNASNNTSSTNVSNILTNSNEQVLTSPSMPVISETPNWTDADTKLSNRSNNANSNDSDNDSDDAFSPMTPKTVYFGTMAPLAPHGINGDLSFANKFRLH